MVRFDRRLLLQVYILVSTKHPQSAFQLSHIKCIEMSDWGADGTYRCSGDEVDPEGIER